MTLKICWNQVKAPLVGTFYRKPSPDSDPFVKVGDDVKKGQVLCIIEAMKMMNEIKSEFDGKVSSIEVRMGSRLNLVKHYCYSINKCHLKS